MRGNSIDEQFDNAESEFTEDQDQEVLKQNRKLFKDADEIRSFAESPAGRHLITSTKEELTKSLLLLFETRKGRYLSEVESLFNLLSKITSAKGKAEAIQDWLNSLS